MRRLTAARTHEHNQHRCSICSPSDASLPNVSVQEGIAALALAAWRQQARSWQQQQLLLLLIIICLSLPARRQQG